MVLDLAVQCFIISTKTMINYRKWLSMIYLKKQCTIVYIFVDHNKESILIEECRSRYAYFTLNRLIIQAEVLIYDKNALKCCCQKFAQDLKMLESSSRVWFDHGCNAARHVLTIASCYSWRRVTGLHAVYVYINLLRLIFILISHINIIIVTKWL